MTQKENFQTDLINQIYKRIEDSNKTEKEKESLLIQLNNKTKNRTKEYNQIVNQFFKPYMKDGLIKNNIKTPNVNDLNQEQKFALSMIMDSIDKNRSRIYKNKDFFIKQREVSPSIEQFTLDQNSYNSDILNQNNYSDFLDGKLDKHIRPKITMIVAYDEDYGIGLNGTLPWHIPQDLKFFKEYTIGKPVVMGGTNYKDISAFTKGNGLPHRRNIVLSSQEHNNKNFEFYKDISDILEALKDEKEIVIIGGTMLYETFLPIADELIVTEIHHKFETDVKFPQFKDKFICCSEQNLTVDSKKSHKSYNVDPVDVSFKRYLRLSPPSYKGISHIKGENKHFDYNNVSWTKYNNFIPDTLVYLPPDILLNSILELIFNTPLPVMVFETLLDTGNFIFSDNSIIYWIPDLYASFMEHPDTSILDFLDLSNFDFEWIGDIGEFLGESFEVILEILSSLLS